MRILAIRGRNLASLAGDFEVDFEAEPLGSSPIFAIIGPTGAGKSTLLDAICLALFREVPRLRNAPSQGSIGADSISPRDPRALMRHGASDAYAEVDFAMPDGERYRAKWSVARARTGTLKNDDHAFERLSDGERFGGTRRETAAAILAVIGLTADQFCRAALLAQGDFDAFVKADAGERAELLERLTGTGVYAELGKAAFVRANEHRQRIAAIGRDIAAQNGLDDAQRAELETALQAASITLDDLRGDLGRHEDARRWEQRSQELSGLIDAAAESQRAASEAEASAQPRKAALARARSAFGFTPKWQALAQARAAQQARSDGLEALRGELASCHEAVSQAEAHDLASEHALVRQREAARALESEIGRATQLDALLKQAVRQAESAASRCSETMQGAEAALEAHSAARQALDLAMADAASTKAWLEDNASLAAISAREVELSEVFAAHADKNGRLARLLGKAADAEAELLGAQARLDTAQDAVAQAAAMLEAVVPEREAAELAAPGADTETHLAEQRDSLSRIAQLAERAAGAAVTATEAAEALEQTRLRQAAIRADLEAMAVRRAEISADLPGELARREEALALAERLAAAVDDAAVRLRESLVPGEPCAVCGARDHDLALVSGVLGEHVADARRKASALANEVAALEKEVAGLAVSTELLERQQSQAAGDEVAQHRRYEDAAKHAAGLARKLADAAVAAGVDPAAGNLTEDLASRLGALDLEISRARAARLRRDEALTAERAARAALDEARDQASNAKEAFDQRKQAQLDLESEMRSLRSDRDQMAGQLDRALTGICHWPDLPDGELWLAETCRQWREAAAAAETAAVRIAEAEALVSDKLIAARSWQDRLDEARKSHKAAQVDADARVQERSALLGGEAVAEVTARLHRQAQALETARTAARSALAEASTARSAAEAKFQQVESQMAAACVHIAADTAALAAELEAAAIDEAEVAKAAAAGSAALNAEADALAEIERAASSAALLLEKRREDLARHQAADVPNLLGEVLAEALIAARASVEAADREVRNLELRLREDDTVRTRTAALRAELEAANADAAVWLTLDGLIGDATGKKFRSIAQGLTLDRLLVHANARLADLKPRYSLARGAGGDMIIEVLDNDMAGQVRGLHNLSGGERFLVSLALALGLAEMSTARGMRIESLFIDEGFGALDPESLVQALALLEHLHAGGRRVGVISHVEELKERIAAKVEVAPTGRGTSKVRVLVSS